MNFISFFSDKWWEHRVRTAPVDKIADQRLLSAIAGDLRIARDSRGRARRVAAMRKVTDLKVLEWGLYHELPLDLNLAALENPTPEWQEKLATLIHERLRDEVYEAAMRILTDRMVVESNKRASADIYGHLCQLADLSLFRPSGRRHFRPFAEFIVRFARKHAIDASQICNAVVDCGNEKLVNSGEVIKAIAELAPASFQDNCLRILRSSGCDLVMVQVMAELLQGKSVLPGLREKFLAYLEKREHFRLGNLDSGWDGYGSTAREKPIREAVAAVLGVKM